MAGTQTKVSKEEGKRDEKMWTYIGSEWNGLSVSEPRSYLCCDRWLCYAVWMCSSIQVTGASFERRQGEACGNSACAG
jgi:hypothetical protein